MAETPANPSDVNGGGAPAGAPSTPAKPTGGDTPPAAPATPPATPAAPAAPAGGEPKPGDGSQTTVPAARHAAEVSRWRKRAEEAEARIAAQSLVPGATPATPAQPAAPAAPAGGEGGTPPATPPASQFVTRDELARDARVNELVAEARDCASRYNGENGWPKFDVDAATEFMKKNRISSYEHAYRLMHEEAIRDAEVAKAVEEAKAGNAGQTRAKGGQGFGQPAAPGAVSREGLAKMPLDEFKKMGGAKALRDAVLSGQIQ